jgi:SPX domain protein involved in polyphosphate accumulation
MSIKTSLPPKLERHELKYTIPYSLVEPISSFLKLYCELDFYSEQSQDHFYQVNSLYFDTRSLEFLQQRLFGKNGRFNVRVRAYGNGSKAPFFLEIKQKHGFTGVKFRANANASEWPAILTDPAFQINPNDSLRERENKALFYRVAQSYAIEPKILTQYQRRAFISIVDDYARVTMDTNMKYQLQSEYSLCATGPLINYDNENIYAKNHANEASVILELKCNIGQVPMWMLDLISTFELKQQGFSKYANSSLVALFDDGATYMNSDRILSVF